MSIVSGVDGEFKFVEGSLVEVFKPLSAGQKQMTFVLRNFCNRISYDFAKFFGSLFQVVQPIRPTEISTDREIEAYIDEAKLICQAARDSLLTKGIGAEELLHVAPVRGCLSKRSIDPPKVVSSEIITVLLDRDATELWNATDTLESKIRLIIKEIQRLSFSQRNQIGIRTYVMIYVSKKHQKNENKPIAIDFELRRHTRSSVIEEHERNELIELLKTLFKEEVVAAAINLGYRAMYKNKKIIIPGILAANVLTQKKVSREVRISAYLALVVGFLSFISVIAIPLILLLRDNGPVLVIILSVIVMFSGYGLLFSSELFNRINAYREP